MKVVGSLLKRRLKLRGILMLLIVLVAGSSLLLTILLITQTVRDNMVENQEEKARMVSRMAARSEVVVKALESEAERNGEIQQYATEIQQLTNVSFVVVMDMNGIRKSHPDPNLIGKRFIGGDEKVVLEGEEYISRSTGTLGESLRAFTPIYGRDGRQLGAVAVGITMDNVQQALIRSNANILTGSVIGLIVGITGAYIVAAYIRRILFGLEPFEIAKAFGERNAMLQSVHEGIVAVDKDRTISLVNQSAVRLFRTAGLSDQPVGLKIADYLPASRLDQVIETGKPETDVEHHINGVSIVANYVPLVVNKKIEGAISTFRDKTEMNLLAEQLTGARTYAEALRAQTHEFMNRLHVILGMAKLEYYEELEDFIQELVDFRTLEVSMVTQHIKEPVLAGFLIGKLSYAREAGVDLAIESGTAVPAPKRSETVHELITILGNLIDNSVEALAECDRKQIRLKLNYHDQKVDVTVSDSGPGIDDRLAGRVFEKGFSTKGDHRGYGLHLVQRSVGKLGGSISLTSHIGEGTTLNIELPYEVREDHD